MMTEAEIRELGAATRTFRTVREILFWIGEEMDRRMAPRSAALELASPRSSNEIAEGIATLAAVIWQLESARREVDPRCWRHLFVWQRGWNQPDDGFAKEWGFRNFHEMRREMYRTEAVLRETFTKRGLLTERPLQEVT